MSDPQAFNTSPSPYQNPYAPPVATVGGLQSESDFTSLADPLTRLFAKILDQLSLAGAILPGLLLGLFVSSNEALGIAMLVGMGLGVVAWIGWTLKLLSENGQTIGKRALGIKIVSQDGSAVDVSKVVLIRFLATQLLAGFIPFFGLVDVLLVFREDRRCIHDMMAGTKVVNA